MTTEIELLENEILVMRTVNSEGKSYGGFQWPLTVGEYAEAPDWRDDSNCGHGLHGLPWGEGGAVYYSANGDSKWLLVAVNTTEGYQHGAGNMQDKCKFRRGRVAFVGTREECTEILSRMAPAGTRLNFLTTSGGDAATVSGGYGATVSGGDYATVSGCDYATVSGGDGATVSGGDGATVSGGNYATVSGGYGATVSGGDYATVSGCDYATVSGGDGATVSGGSRATVSGGNAATVSGGNYATVSGGSRSTVSGGYGATVSGGDYATVSGGDYATVSGGDGIYQKSGKNSVQITHWTEGDKVKTACRLVDDTMANKWYHVKSGVWTPLAKNVQLWTKIPPAAICTEEKSAELGGKGKTK